jgi:hypothetical protein
LTKIGFPVAAERRGGSWSLIDAGGVEIASGMTEPAARLIEAHLRYCDVVTVPVDEWRKLLRKGEVSVHKVDSGLPSVAAVAGSMRAWQWLPELGKAVPEGEIRVAVEDEGMGWFRLKAIGGGL